MAGRHDVGYDAGAAEVVEGRVPAPPCSFENDIFEVGKQHYGNEKLRDWFQALYETLLGSSQGPRMGSFIALYGIENSRRLIEEALTA